MATLPIQVICPACNAQPGNPCTQPDDRSRHSVKFFHYTRIESAEKGGPHSDEELQRLLESTSMAANEKIREQQHAAAVRAELEIPEQLQPDRWSKQVHGLIAHEPCGAVFIPGPSTKALHEATCPSIVAKLTEEQTEEARTRPPALTREESEERQIAWAISRHKRQYARERSPFEKGQDDRAADLLSALGLRPYNVYSEGYAANEGRSGAISHGVHWGRSFNDAIARWKDEGGKDAQYLSSRTDNLGREQWTYWGCKLFDNMADAQRSFG